MSLEGNVDVKAQPVAALIFRRVEEITDPPVVAMEQTAGLVPEAEAASLDVEADLRAAHEKGRREAFVTAEAEFSVRLQQERDALSRIMHQFAEEKQRYFTDMEGEVVKLSLAIAERVIHREAEMDPLLLAGAARVALDHVSDASEAVLRVAAADLGQWNEALKPMPEGITIEADQTMSRGDAVLKTHSGTVQLGLRAQLQEIEHGFFELLGRKPSMMA